MNSNRYTPKPLDTSEIELPEELLQLGESLARNVHEVWAQGRIDDGWIWGDKLDKIAKTHPSLIPYEQLSDSEKDYDRRTSIETLKFIVKEGYSLVPKDRK